MSAIIKYNIYITVGVPASGKSTYCREHFPPDIIVSRDAIRFSMIGEQDAYFSKEKQVYQEYVKRIVDTTKTFNTCVCDATHLDWKARAKLINALNDASLKNQYRITYLVFDTPLRTCIERNEKRTGRAKVPRDVLESMYRCLSVPELSADENVSEVRVIKYEQNLD